MMALVFMSMLINDDDDDEDKVAHLNLYTVLCTEMKDTFSSTE